MRSWDYLTKEEKMKRLADAINNKTVRHDDPESTETDYIPDTEPAFNWLFWATVAVVVAIVVALVSVRPAHADTIDLDAIAQIESSGCKEKISNRPGDQSYGCHQITPGTLSEFNAYNKKRYTKNDLLDNKKSEEVAGWYLNKRIPQMLRHFKKPVTTENILRCYNAGIKSVIDGKTPDVTKKYLKKYAMLTK